MVTTLSSLRSILKKYDPLLDADARAQIEGEKRPDISGREATRSLIEELSVAFPKFEADTFGAPKVESPDLFDMPKMVEQLLDPFKSDVDGETFYTNEGIVEVAGTLFGAGKTADEVKGILIGFGFTEEGLDEVFASTPYQEEAPEKELRVPFADKETERILVAYATSSPDEFIESIREIGRSPKVESVLKALDPTLNEDDFQVIFGGFQATMDPYELSMAQSEAKRLADLQPKMETYGDITAPSDAWIAYGDRHRLALAYIPPDLQMRLSSAPVEAWPSKYVEQVQSFLKAATPEPPAAYDYELEAAKHQMKTPDNDDWALMYRELRALELGRGQFGVPEKVEEFKKRYYLTDKDVATLTTYGWTQSVHAIKVPDIVHEFIPFAVEAALIAAMLPNISVRAGVSVLQALRVDVQWLGKKFITPILKREVAAVAKQSGIKLTEAESNAIIAQINERVSISRTMKNIVESMKNRRNMSSAEAEKVAKEYAEAYADEATETIVKLIPERATLVVEAEKTMAVPRLTAPPAQVQVLITKDMESKLAALGYSSGVVKNMKPQEAADIIADGVMVEKAIPTTHEVAVHREFIRQTASKRDRIVVENSDDLARGKYKLTVSDDITGDIKATEYFDDLEGTIASNFGKAGTVKEVGIPKPPAQEAGMPEAGLQAGFGGETVPFVPPTKGKITQVSMDDQIRLEQARREVVEGTYNAEAQFEGLRETMATDPVASYRGTVGAKKNVKLTSIVKPNGDIPETVTLKQAEFLMKGKKPTGVIVQKGRVATLVALDQMAFDFGMTADELQARILQVWKDERRVTELTQEIKETASLVKEMESEVAISATHNDIVKTGIRDVLEQSDNMKELETILMTSARQEKIITFEKAYDRLYKQREDLIDQGLTPEELSSEGYSLKQIEDTARKIGLSGPIKEKMLVVPENLLTQKAIDASYKMIKDAFYGIDNYALISANKALSRALAGYRIPDIPGTKGGSSKKLLEYVFGKETVKAIDDFNDAGIFVESVGPVPPATEGVVGKGIPTEVGEVITLGRKKAPKIGTGMDAKPVEGFVPYESKLPPQKTAFGLQEPKGKGASTPVPIHPVTPPSTVMSLPEGERVKAIIDLDHSLDWVRRPDIWEQFSGAEQIQLMDHFKLINEPTHLSSMDQGQFLAFVKAVGEKGTQGVIINTRTGEQIAIELARRIGLGLVDVINLPRALKASMDLSFTMRQGALWAISEPRIAKDVLGKQIQAFAGEGAYLEFDQMMRNHRHFDFLSRPTSEGGCGIDFTQIGKLARKRGQIEEPFQSKIVEHIPGISNSERAFTIAANWTRLLVGSKYTDELNLTNPGNVRLRKAFGGLINASTGRGPMPLKDLNYLMNTAFWSVRNQTGRIVGPTYMIRGANFFDIKDPVRKLAWKLYGKYVAFVTSIVGLATLAGAAATSDYLSSDYGKIKIGDTRIDLGAGNLQYLNFFARIIKGQTTTSLGERIDIDRGDLILGFLRSKLSPGVGTGLSLGTHSGYFGQEVTPEYYTTSDGMRDLFMPLVLDSFITIFQEEGLSINLMMGIPEIFGVSTNTYRTNSELWSDLREKFVSTIGFDKIDPQTGEVIGKVENWDELNSLQKNELNRNPEYVKESEALEKRLRDQGFAEREGWKKYNTLEDKRVQDGEDIIRDYNIALGDPPANTFTGEPETARALAGKLQDMVQDIVSETNNKQMQVSDDFDLFERNGELPDNEFDEAIVKYYAIWQSAEDEIKKSGVDKITAFNFWEVFGDMKDKLYSELSPAQIAYLDAFIARPQWGTLMQEYQDARNILSNTKNADGLTYFDIQGARQRKVFRYENPEVNAVLEGKWYNYVPISGEAEKISLQWADAYDASDAIDAKHKDVKDERKRSELIKADMNNLYVEYPGFWEADNKRTAYNEGFTDITGYVDLQREVDRTSPNSKEVKYFKIQNTSLLKEGLERNKVNSSHGWEDNLEDYVDLATGEFTQKGKGLKLWIENPDLDKYENFSKEGSANYLPSISDKNDPLYQTGREYAREQMQLDQTFVDKQREYKALDSYGWSDEITAQHVEASRLKDESDSVKGYTDNDFNRFMYENSLLPEPNYYSEWLTVEGHQSLDKEFAELPSPEYDKLLESQEIQDVFQLKKDNGWGKDQLVQHLVATNQYGIIDDIYKMDAYIKGYPDEMVEDYVLAKATSGLTGVTESNGWALKRYLGANQDLFLEAMDRGGLGIVIDPTDLTLADVPSFEGLKLVKEYLKSDDRVTFRKENDLDEFLIRAYGFDKVPSPEVESLYEKYSRMIDSTAKYTFRYENPTLDAWGALNGKWSPVVPKFVKRLGPAGEKFAEIEAVKRALGR